MTTGHNLDAALRGARLKLRVRFDVAPIDSGQWRPFTDNDSYNIRRAWPRNGEAPSWDDLWAEIGGIVSGPHTVRPSRATAPPLPAKAGR